MDTSTARIKSDLDAGDEFKAHTRLIAREMRRKSPKSSAMMKAWAEGHQGGKTRINAFIQEQST